jgi:hypothetical protein
MREGEERERKLGVRKDGRESRTKKDKTGSKAVFQFIG